MKKTIFVVTLFAIAAGFISAGEAGRFSLGTGIEGNMYTRSDAALGAHIGADYGIISPLTVGLKFGFSHNFNGVMTLEPAAYLRWYYFTLNDFPLFLQADAGASILFEDQTSYAAPQGGISAGIRFPLNNWFIEPYVRAGYPYIWGAGITAGYRF